MKEIEPTDPTITEGMVDVICLDYREISREALDLIDEVLQTHGLEVTLVADESDTWQFTVNKREIDSECDLAKERKQILEPVYK